MNKSLYGAWSMVNIIKKLLIIINILLIRNVQVLIRVHSNLLFNSKYKNFELNFVF